MFHAEMMFYLHKIDNQRPRNDLTYIAEKGNYYLIVEIIRWIGIPQPIGARIVVSQQRGLRNRHNSLHSIVFINI